MSSREPPPGGLELRVDTERGHAVIHAAGDLDASTAHALVVAVCEALEDHRRVELDLSGIAFIDAAGFGALEACARSAGEHRWDFFVSGESPAIDHVTHALPMADRLLHRFRKRPFR